MALTGDIFSGPTFESAHFGCVVRRGSDGCHGYIRSSDNGSTWRWQPKPPHFYEGSGHLRVTKAGILESYAMGPPVGSPVAIIKSHSTDNGLTFAKKGEPGCKEVATLKLSIPAVDHMGTMSLGINASDLSIGGPMVGLTLRDGTFMLFGVAHTAMSVNAVGNREYYFSKVANTPAVGINWCIRSTDGGESFAKPTNLDGQPLAPNSPRNVEGTWDRTFPRGNPMQALEISPVETSGGGVMTLNRAAASPWMWEGRSGDGGVSWEPLRRGQF